MNSNINFDALPRRGMTLIELLVVIAILVGLLAVSVPFFKPMLESRRTFDGASVLAAALQQARVKAIQEQRNYGLRFVPIETAPTTSLQLRQQKEDITFSVNSDEHHRVIVLNGLIIPVWNDGTHPQWRPESDLDASVPAEKREIDVLQWELSKMRKGNKIQFGHQGRTYIVGDNHTLAAPYDHLTLPEGTTLADIRDALDFRITPPPTSALVPQTVMPRGTIVDLAFSGGGNLFGIPVQFPANTPVTVMFSPKGNVDAVYFGADGEDRRLVNEMLYFCVGEWDRQTGKSGEPLADDGKSNIEIPAAYWVTVHPKTGEVRITENFPDDDIETARKFAREHFVNVGGD